MVDKTTLLKGENTDEVKTFESVTSYKILQAVSADF